MGMELEKIDTYISSGANECVRTAWPPWLLRPDEALSITKR
jgi:hypothetical protein